MKLIGTILAGGESRRMGEDKAKLPINNGTLLDLMERKLQLLPIIDTIVVCGNRAGGLPDIKPGLGPIGALYTLSMHYEDHLALIVPVDMPLLTTEALEKLCKTNLEKHNALYYEKHNFPLLLRLGREVKSHLATQIGGQTPDLSIATLLREIQAKPLSIPENTEQFKNSNTREDWRNIRILISEYY